MHNTFTNTSMLTEVQPNTFKNTESQNPACCTAKFATCSGYSTYAHEDKS